MGGVAALAREAGHTVTGCDIGVYPPMSDQLRALGIALIDGFDEDQIETLASRPDMYVIGNVVSRARATDGQPTFPLMERILNEGLPYTSGPQWLSEHVLQAVMCSPWRARTAKPPHQPCSLGCFKKRVVTRASWLAASP